MDDLGENLTIDTDGPDIEPAGVSGAEHLADFRAPEIETSGGGEDDVISVDAEGVPIAGEFDGEEIVELMSKEAFYTVFTHSFGLPGMFSTDWRPLAIQEGEEPIARDASDAIYELLEIYYPNALMPQGDTFARFARAAPFILAKVMVVREILNAKKRAKLDAMRPANHTRAPEAAPEFKSQRAEGHETPNSNYEAQSGPYIAPLNEFAEVDAA